MDFDPPIGFAALLKELQRLQFPPTCQLSVQCCAVQGAGLTYLYFCQVFSYPLKFCCHLGIPFRAFAETIGRLTEAAQITAQSRAEVRQRQVFVIPP